MHCNKVSFQELLDCFDNDLGNNLENNAHNFIMQKNYRKF